MAVEGGCEPSAGLHERNRPVGMYKTTSLAACSAWGCADVLMCEHASLPRAHLSKITERDSVTACGGGKH